MPYFLMLLHSLAWYPYFSTFRIPLTDAQWLLWAVTTVILSCPTLTELCHSLRFVTIGFWIPSSPPAPGSPLFSFTGSPLLHDFKSSCNKPFSMVSLPVRLGVCLQLTFQVVNSPKFLFVDWTFVELKISTRYLHLSMPHISTPKRLNEHQTSLCRC